MKYQLIKPINLKYSVTQQILTNRGIPIDDVFDYLNTVDDDINPPESLGEKKLRAAAQLLIKTIKENTRCLVIVDSDCDGFTSSALLINYLYDFFPAWVENKLTYVFHKGKEHGLNDYIDAILSDPSFFSLVIFLFTRKRNK